MSRRADPEHDEWVQGVVDRFQGPLTLYAARLLRDQEACA